MASIAVLFGTTDGQTAKIARHVAAVLRNEGHAVSLIDTREPAPPLPDMEGAVLLASVRMGKFQRPFVNFVRAHRNELARVPTLFLPVSLSASRTTPAAQREVHKTIARFQDETGFGPGAIEPVAGALLYTKYNFFIRLMMIFISKIAGGDTDASRDYEYTDWIAVSGFARQFAARVREEPADAPRPIPADGGAADAAP